ncbi:heat shock 22 kDa protein, mitochondrial-like [Telopea speciosissima]|uniref:heat shock 22 kDa protein, mitochondrial-like n=1 Tax=Telopea speciosissima TaxID=54955 RepID=UPI001CC7E39A|nr:heat shock 22 kDa protein, mitochondrial-like [Telopea speciosissima]
MAVAAVDHGGGSGDDDDGGNGGNELDPSSSSLSSRNRIFEMKYGENGLSIMIEMEFVGKEDVKVSVEQNKIFSTGGIWIELGKELYKKKNQIKVEMKNGVLRMIIPKVKEEEEEEKKERKDVHHVQITHL